MRRRLSNAQEEEDDPDSIRVQDSPFTEWDESELEMRNLSNSSNPAQQTAIANKLKSDRSLIPSPNDARRSSSVVSLSTDVPKQTTSTPTSALTPEDPSMAEPSAAWRRRPRLRSPWASSMLTLLSTVLAVTILCGCFYSSISRQIDPAGCHMSYMRQAYAKLDGFDTEHTRFASKYSLYLYREEGIDEDTRVKGVPVLFIPGNAGSYKQVRPIAAEAAYYFHDVLQHDAAAIDAGASSLDFFTADFNEDITAFHGRTLLDQAEYLNEAVAYILSLYHDPRRSVRGTGLPDPSSVILIGHSMGGIVARAMLTMQNYQSNSINTIITMSAPHARAPVAFDGEIVRTYQQINDHWRKAYSQKWANNNPLWHVTLISVAGGGLDTVIPSDFASVASLVPETHGFTVFTSTIPHVWTGMDHQAILWCDQFRKVLVRALMEVLNVNRPGQTKPRAERMRIFRRKFLTGMESTAEKMIPHQKPTTLLTLEDHSNSVLAQGEPVILRTLGHSTKPKAHLLPVPPHAALAGKRFTLLTDQLLDSKDGNVNLQVLMCSVFPLEMGQSAMVFSLNMDLSGDGSGSTRLACKDAAVDVIRLPASTPSSKFPFDERAPFSYLQYNTEEISDHQFVAIVDKALQPTSGWVMAEFSQGSTSEINTTPSISRLLTSGLTVQLPAERALVSRIHIPAIQSGLLAYKIQVGNQGCGDDGQLFTPLLRQSLSDPYESKFFVNVKRADLNLHGLAPFMPPPLRQEGFEDGLSLDVWSDFTCDSSIDVTLTVDLFGSLGKLVVRYRTVFAAFPLLVASLVLRRQFSIYDTSGTFVSFSAALDLCLRQSIPVVFLALSLFALSLPGARSNRSSSNGWFHWRGNATETVIDFTKNEILLGSQDPFFWFLVPLFGLVSVGGCVVMNYTVMAIVHILSVVYGLLAYRPSWMSNDDRRKPATMATTTFVASSPARRVVTASILLFLVSTIIPYQFAYLVACVVQIMTCTRALKLARETRSGTHFNFYNYTHSLLVLMIWVLPINTPVLIVWIHNLSVHWLTPFSSHHNVFSVMPIILLVETLVSGHMIPGISTRPQYIIQILFLFLALFAAFYGVSYAYVLHQLLNVIAAWLVAIHSSGYGKTNDPNTNNPVNDDTAAAASASSASAIAGPVVASASASAAANSPPFSLTRLLNFFERDHIDPSHDNKKRP